MHHFQSRAPVAPKKSLGQHFLTDLSVAQRIADTVDTLPRIPVLEVGPGTGVLSRFLLPKGRALTAVELDRRSVDYLREHLPELQVVEADFLRMALPEEPFVLTGNYPYNISSQIFFKMLEHRDRIPLCTGMVQLEVAQRLASPPGNKAYGVLSVMVQAWYDVSLLFVVPHTAFNPPPKVESAVVSLRRNARTALPCDESLFRNVVKTTFQQRRKMLRVSLRPLLDGAKPQTDCFDEQLLTRRPETLSVEEFADLANRLQAQRQATQG